MIDLRYVKMVKPETIVYHTYNDISKKLIDKLCVSGEIDIKTDLKIMHIVNVLGLATKCYNIRKNIVIGIIN